jgi:uncharacterized membrane-anchored protein
MALLLLLLVLIVALALVLPALASRPGKLARWREKIGL